MPSVSKAQQRLMGAAEHGADFPMARKLRSSMSHDQLHDFAAGPEKGKPEHVRPAKATANVTLPMRDFAAEHSHLAKVLKSGTPGQRQAEAAKQGAELKAKVGAHPGGNLGKYLHPKGGR